MTAIIILVEFSDKISSEISSVAAMSGRRQISAMCYGGGLLTHSINIFGTYAIMRSEMEGGQTVSTHTVPNDRVVVFSH